MTNKTYSFLGLAKKAGKVISGDESCEKAIKSGKVELIIVAKDASPNTSKKFMDMCSYRHLNFRTFGIKEELGRMLGKDVRSVVAIVEKGFAGRMIELIDSESTELGGEHNG